jgi:anti-sigma factor RsiW
MMKPVITEADLHAWVDGHLSEASRADVDAWLAGNPRDAERVAHYRRQMDGLHNAYDAVLEEPVPAHLSALLQRPQRTPRARQAIAAAVAWCALGGILGGLAGVAGGWYWFGRPAAVSADARHAPLFVRQAALAHAVYSPEVRHPVEVGADQEAHLAAWLSKRLGTQLRVPHLAEQGYALVGGRLLPGQPDERGPVAQFMYQDAKGLRLTLYVRTDNKPSGETAFRFAQEKSVGVFYWVDQKLGYALSGEVDKGELLRVANAVYKQLNP